MSDLVIDYKPTSLEINRFLLPQPSLVSLPEELLVHLFSLFKGFEIPTLQQVCKRFSLIGKDERLWQIFLQREFLLTTYKTGSPAFLLNQKSWNSSIFNLSI